MLVALPELFRLLAYFHPLMFGGQFWRMIFLIALHAEVCILCDTVIFGIFWWYFIAIFTQGSL